MSWLQCIHRAPSNTLVSPKYSRFSLLRIFWYPQKGQPAVFALTGVLSEVLLFILLNLFLENFREFAYL